MGDFSIYTDAQIYTMDHPDITVCSFWKIYGEYGILFFQLDNCYIFFAP